MKSQKALEEPPSKFIVGSGSKGEDDGADLDDDTQVCSCHVSILLSARRQFHISYMFVECHKECNWRVRESRYRYFIRPQG